MTWARKKGQEEIVGFVAVVVLVAIVFLVFLGISLRQKPEIQKESGEIRTFLRSAGEYTSECALGYEPNYRRLSELFKDCYEGKKCVSEKEACQVLNETLNNILDASWQIGEERAIKSYEFKALYVENSTSEEKEETITDIKKGECSSGIVKGAEDFYSSYPGRIIYSLQLCY